MRPGDVLSYLDMCAREGVSLQRGMNFRLKPTHSVMLMSVRQGAPYEDQVLDEGETMIYEGHDVPRSKENPDPKVVDQPLFTPNGAPTQNGLFYRAAEDFANGVAPAERVRVYEKVKGGIWVYTGLFTLVDAWTEPSSERSVCKFRLELSHEEVASEPVPDPEHSRIIPTSVKLEVWSRDKGRCVMCGDTKNLHFDHIIPYSKGGSSLTAANIQLLCAKHNLQKHDRVV